jgi:hypothetical protein
VTAGEIAAIAVSAALGIAVVGLLFALGAAIRTLGAMRAAIDDVRRVSIPLLTDLHSAVRKADADLGRMEGVLERAESISGTVDSASRLAYTAFSSPLVKMMALGSGVARGFRRLRRK